MSRSLFPAASNSVPKNACSLTSVRSDVEKTRWFQWRPRRFELCSSEFTTRGKEDQLKGSRRPGGKVPQDAGRGHEALASTGRLIALT